MAANADEELTSLANLIRELWPDFPSFTLDKLQRPTSEFVLTFYKIILMDIDEKMGLIGGQCFDYVGENLAQNNDPLWICARARNILKWFQINYFNLNDLYRPSLRRSIQCMKVVINFFLYLTTKATETEVASSKVLKIADQINYLYDEHNMLETEIGNAAMLHAKREDQINSYQQEYDQLQKKYKELQAITEVKNVGNEKMKSELKSVSEKRKEKLEILEKLRNDKKKLKEQLVDVEELERLKALKVNLQTDSSELKDTDEGYSESLENKKQGAKHFESLATHLDSPDFQNLDDIELLQKIKSVLLLKELSIKKQSAVNLNAKELKVVHNLKCQKEMMHLINQTDNEKQKLSDEKEHHKVVINQVISNKKDIETQQITLKTEINHKQTRCLKLETDIDILNQAQGNNYKQMLNLESSVTTYFNNILLDLGQQVHNL